MSLSFHVQHLLLLEEVLVIALLILLVLVAVYHHRRLAVCRCRYVRGRVRGLWCCWWLLVDTYRMEGQIRKAHHGPILKVQLGFEYHRG